MREIIPQIAPDEVRQAEQPEARSNAPLKPNPEIRKGPRFVRR